ncbi:MAG: hypothetical protein KKB31_07800 [Nanoarchaeota archaeon]|nr:hypothetical protein [Nanoarchaeota archaeon]
MLCRLVLAVLVALVVSCTPPAPLPPESDTAIAAPPVENLTPDRLAVNDHLRAACYGYAENDLQIEGLLMATEADRLNGMSMQELLDTLNWTCSQFGLRGRPDISVACRTCGYAIIRQIYAY